MTRYVDIDLGALPPPDAVRPLDYEALVAQRKATVLALLADWPDVQLEVAAVLQVEGEPMVKLIEADAYRELLVYGRINDAVRAVLLATSRGNDLDNLCARLGVERQVVTPADPATSPPTAAVLESDADLKERYQLALEAFSTAGPYGAYHFLARSAHPHVARTAVYGPESGLVTPGQVLVVVLSRIGNGAPTEGVLDAVAAALSDADARPLTDQVLVEGSTITDYAVAYEIAVRRGADPTLIAAAAETALATYVANRRRPGARISIEALTGAAFADQINIDDVVRVSPAADVDPGPRGTANCTGITVAWTIVDSDDGSAD